MKDRPYLVLIADRIGRVAAPILLLSLTWEVMRWILVDLAEKPAWYAPPIKEIALQGFDLLKQRSFYDNLLDTTVRVSYSMFLVITWGVLIGTLLGHFRTLYAFIRPAWDFVRSIPPSTLFPIIIVFLGIDSGGKVFTVVYFCTLILSLNVADAIASRDHDMEYAWKTNGVPKRWIFVFVVVPQVGLQVISSLRVIASILIALTLIVEMYLGTTAGIGGALMEAWNLNNYATSYAYIIVAGIFGYILNVSVDLAGRTFLAFGDIK